MRFVQRKLQNFLVAVLEILTDSASICFWLFLLKLGGEAVLESGWEGLWRTLVERSGHQALQLYVLGSTVALLLAYYVPVTLFTILVSLLITNCRNFYFRYFRTF